MPIYPPTYKSKNLKVSLDYLTERMKNNINLNKKTKINVIIP